MLLHQRMIPAKAFYKNRQLNFVHCPFVKTVEQKAFYQCFFLKRFFSKHLESIKEQAFLFCAWLAEIDFSKVIFLGEKALVCCIGLVNIKFDLLEEISKGNFERFEGLKQIIAPKLKFIAEETFEDCKNVNIVTNLIPEIDSDKYKVGKEIKF